MGLSVSHILVVVLVAMLLFGGGRVAEIGKGLGEGIRQLKKGLRESEPPVAPDSAPANGKRRVVEIELQDGEDADEVVRRLHARRDRDRT